MIHLPLVDSKITKIMNDGEEYIVGISMDTVDIYTKIESNIFPFKWHFDKNKVEFVTALIDNRHFEDNDDIETIKIVFNVQDKDIDKCRIELRERLEKYR